MFADQSRKHLREFPEMAIMLTEREPVLSNSRVHHPAAICIGSGRFLPRRSEWHTLRKSCIDVAVGGAKLATKEL